MKKKILLFICFAILITLCFCLVASAEDPTQDKYSGNIFQKISQFFEDIWLQILYLVERITLFVGVVGYGIDYLYQLATNVPIYVYPFVIASLTIAIIKAILNYHY